MSETEDLRELLAQMPTIAEKLDAAAIDSDAEVLALQNWAQRTVAAANAAGRPDIVEKVDASMAKLMAAVERAERATAVRRKAHAHAEEVLKQELDG